MYLFSVKVFTRDNARGVDVSFDGVPLGRTVTEMRGTSKCLFSCSTARVGTRRLMDLGYGGRRIHLTLHGVFRPAGVAFGFRGGRVMLSLSSGRALDSGGKTAGAIANAISSKTKRPVVNTAMVIGNAVGNMLASVSNGCAVGTERNRILRFHCVNCGDIRRGMGSGDIVGVTVTRSGMGLSSIIIVNCNSRGGRDMMSSIGAVGPTRVTVPAHDLSGAVTNRITNIVTVRHSKRPKGSSTSF